MTDPLENPIELSGRLLLGGRFVPGRLTIVGERIESVTPQPIEAAGGDLPLIAPGLVDLHIHGYAGQSPLEDLQALCDGLARAGTTAFQPTLFPDEPTSLGEHAQRVMRKAEGLSGGARIVGLHLEGPFVNPKKAGALPPECLAEPSLQALQAILGSSTGDGRGIRTMTIAPELSGADELIAELVRSGVRASLGHSLSTWSEASAAARAGADGATHLFNAMGPVHHREAGLANFALSDDALYAEIIGDLAHVSAESFQLALRARGVNGLALVSDALWAAGTGCDVFHSHGRRCFVRDGAIWTHPFKTDAPGEQDTESVPILTGASASQFEACGRLVAGGVCTAAEALTMAGETPARALGLEGEIGGLRVGARADLIVVDEGQWGLSCVYVGGKSVV